MFIIIIFRYPEDFFEIPKIDQVINRQKVSTIRYMYYYESQDVIWNRDLIWNVLVCLSSTLCIIYSSLHSLIICVWMRTVCQIILIHYLLLIYHKLLAMAKRSPILYSLPDCYHYHYHYHYRYRCCYSVSQMMVYIKRS